MDLFPITKNHYSGKLMLSFHRILRTSLSVHELHQCTCDYIIATYLSSAVTMCMFSDMVQFFFCIKRSKEKFVFYEF